MGWGTPKFKVDCIAPTKSWYLPFWDILKLMGGVESLEQSPEYRHWFRMNIHMIIEHVLSPLTTAMNDGIYLQCGDGKTRLCFPILYLYPADYQEQATLGNFVNGPCPKCTAPRGHLEEFRVPYLNEEELDPAFDWVNGPPPRTDAHACL